MYLLIDQPINRSMDRYLSVLYQSDSIYLSIHFSIYIYIFGGGPFSAYCFGFLQGKANTAYFSHFEAKKRKGKEQKGRPKLVVLFFGWKSAPFPQFQANVCLKGEQKTRPKVGRKRGLGHSIYLRLYLSTYLPIRSKRCLSLSISISLNTSTLAHSARARLQELAEAFGKIYGIELLAVLRGFLSKLPPEVSS